MIEELHVRDLALIEDVWIELGPGMTVLSGETGAGKTALLGALKLLLGERADSSAVRGGADGALVEGRFRANGEELIVKRRVSSDGRSRCFVGDEMATVGLLAERIGPLVDLHGQHEHQALLSPQSHVGYLDRWAGADVSRAHDAYTLAFGAHGVAVREHAAIASRVQQGARDADYLTFVAEEIDRIDPLPHEDEALRARLPALQHAERLSEAASEVVSLLRSDGGALDRVAAAAAALGKVHGIDPAVDEMAARLAELEALVDDVGSSARQYRDSTEHDPETLDQVLARLSALAGLMKKYGPTLDDVIARRDEAKASLDAANDGEGALAAAAVRVAESEKSLRSAAEALEATRKEAVPGFVSALSDATHDLAMEGARFGVAFTDLAFSEWGAEGPHRVEFMYAAAPGQPLRPLTRIASGGEVSRVMLALKGVLGGADTVETLVFDEVDAGIGGATATAVGRRLAQLARSHQVVVVTHLAQVAAFADEHLVVTKEVTTVGASTRVVRVENDERVSEIARMLSGGDSEAGRAHARELLGSARDAVTAS